MIKRFCDRCNKDITTLPEFEIKFNGSIFTKDDLLVCEKCNRSFRVLFENWMKDGKLK